MNNTEIYFPLNKGFTPSVNPAASGDVSLMRLHNLEYRNGVVRTAPKFVPLRTTPDNFVGTVDNGFAIVSPYRDRRELRYVFKIGERLYSLDPIANAPALEPVMDGATPFKVLTERLDPNDNSPIPDSDIREDLMQFASWSTLNLSAGLGTKPLVGLHYIKVDVGGQVVAQRCTSDSDGSNPVPAEYVPYVIDVYDEATSTTVPHAVILSAKYLLFAKNRMFLGNCFEDTTEYPTRIRWSDLNNPLKWNISSNTSESGYFDLGTNSLEITGLAYQDDYVYTFTRDSIWKSTYEGFDNQYRTEPFSSAAGCAWHYSVITAKNMTFFIGYDNFYVLQSDSITPIGTDIWKWFKENNITDVYDPVVGNYNVKTRTVSWWFRAKGGSPLAISFNIDSGQWSTHDIL